MSSRRRMNTDELMTTVSLRIPARVLKDLKKLKVREGSSISAVATDILEQSLGHSRAA
jgi:hypothetical protein